MSKSLINNTAAPSAKLWLLDVDGVAQDDLDFFTRCLGSDEARRLGSFLRPQRRRQFLLGRTLLRFAVSELTGIPLDTIDIQERRENAPRLILPDSQHARPNFSLSHSRNWVACLVGCGAALGLDIEVHDAHRDIDGIAEIAFHPEQLLWLSSRPIAERLLSFYDLWCEREAFQKLLYNSSGDPDLSSNEAVGIEMRASKRHLRLISGLSIVAVSAHPRFEIQEKVLTTLTRADWMNAARSSGQTHHRAQ